MASHHRLLSRRYKVGGSAGLRFTDLCLFKLGDFKVVSYTPHIADLAALLEHYENKAMQYQTDPMLSRVMREHWERIHDVWMATHSWNVACRRHTRASMNYV
jgi:hypothetical protein